MTQKQITNEIINSQLRLTLQVERSVMLTSSKNILKMTNNILFRGTFIVPSFDEIWPQAGKGRPGDARRKRMGMEYILEVSDSLMRHHCTLGYLEGPGEQSF